MSSRDFREGGESSGCRTLSICEVLWVGDWPFVWMGMLVGLGGKVSCHLNF